MLKKHCLPLVSKVYFLYIPIPKYIFNGNYPTNPRTFGEKIRKCRMDAGLQIKELAKMIGGTEDTVINWEIRGIKPANWSKKKVEKFMSD